MTKKSYQKLQNWLLIETNSAKKDKRKNYSFQKKELSLQQILVNN